MVCDKLALGLRLITEISSRLVSPLFWMFGASFLACSTLFYRKHALITAVVWLMKPPFSAMQMVCDKLALGLHLITEISSRLFSPLFWLFGASFWTGLI